MDTDMEINDDARAEDYTRFLNALSKEKLIEKVLWESDGGWHNESFTEWIIQENDASVNADDDDVRCTLYPGYLLQREKEELIVFITDTSPTGTNDDCFNAYLRDGKG